MRPNQISALLCFLFDSINMTDQMAAQRVAGQPHNPPVNRPLAGYVNSFCVQKGMVSAYLGNPSISCANACSL